MKRQTIKWEKIYLIYRYEKELLARKNEEWLINNKRTYNPTLKKGKKLNEHFAKEDTQKTCEYM